MTRHDDLTEQILIRWKTEHAALALAIARLESDLARFASGTGPAENLWDSPRDVTAPPFTVGPQKLTVIRASRAASGPASKPLHWTQRPENRAKVRRQLRKATAARGTR